MADIFISYASEDRSRALQLVNALQEQGWSVWWDRTIPPGKTFDQVIEEAINAARCVVVLWSEQSIKSDWVKEEANIGQHRKILVPAKIDPVDPPLGFGRIQAADLTDWEKETIHPGFEVFLSAISDILESPPQQEKGDQIADIPESNVEQQLKEKPKESETPQPEHIDQKPFEIGSSIAGPKAPHKKWLTFGIGGIALIIIIGIIGWFLYSEYFRVTPTQPPKRKPRPTPTTRAVVIPNTNHRFVEKIGHLVSTANGNPLCPTPPGWRTDCYAIESQYRQNWRNTPDGYVANGKKVKIFTNRSERIFEILGTKHAFYVDDGHLFYYHTATILCPWPKAGVAKCHKIEAKYEDLWRNTPQGFIANGRSFDAIEVMRDVRQGLF